MWNLQSAFVCFVIFTIEFHVLHVYGASTSELHTLQLAISLADLGIWHWPSFNLLQAALDSLTFVCEA